MMERLKMTEPMQGHLILEVFQKCLSTANWISGMTPQWPEFMCLSLMHIMLLSHCQRRGSRMHARTHLLLSLRAKRAT